MFESKFIDYTISFTVKLWDDNPWDGTKAEYHSGELHATSEQEVKQKIAALKEHYNDNKITRLTITTYEELI